MNEADYYNTKIELADALEAGDWLDACAESGVDAEPAVRAAMMDPEIAAILDQFDLEWVRRDLGEYGAWTQDELSDRDFALARLVWIVALDRMEGYL